jgi:cytochrome c-type biogenesis protein
MSSVSDVSLLIAFSAGFLSFVSPCVLPLVPSYISYVTGLSLEELTRSGQRERSRRIAVTNSLMFIAGFSTVFIFFGASATVVGRFLLVHQSMIRRIGGVLIVLFGLYILGLFKVGFLARDVRYRLQDKPAGYLGSFAVGVAFASGWTPCVGPILGSILLYAGTSGSILTGVLLLSAYSLGLGLPLFLSSLGVQSFLGYFKQVSRYLWLVSTLSGVFLVIMGLMIFSNSFTRLTAKLSQIGIGWSIGQ